MVLGFEIGSTIDQGVSNRAVTKIAGCGKSRIALGILGLLVCTLIQQRRYGI